EGKRAAWRERRTEEDKARLDKFGTGRDIFDCEVLVVVAGRFDAADDVDDGFEQSHLEGRFQRLARRWHHVVDGGVWRRDRDSGFSEQRGDGQMSRQLDFADLRVSWTRRRFELGEFALRRCQRIDAE